MIQLVWLKIGFQIFNAFTPSYKLFIPSSYRVFSFQEFKQIDSRTSCSSSKWKEKKKKESVWNLALKEEKNLGFYETLLAELRLEDEHNCNILLRMTSENFEEIFQFINEDITKENTTIR